MVAHLKAYMALVVICSTQSIASGQQTKTFPEAECSYTLSGEDWEWLDPALVQLPDAKTICFAHNSKGLRFTIRFAPIKSKDTTPTRRFEGFEAGILKSGDLKKLGSKVIEFQGVPCFQIDLVNARGQGSAVRVMFANDRFYHLQVVNTDGPLGPEVETQAVFEGFSFTGQPRVPATPEEDVNFERGKEAGGFISAILIVLFIVGIIALVVYLSRSHSRSDELNEDYHDRR